MPTSTLLTVAEASERLGLSVTRVTQLCATGRLGQRIGRQYLIEAAELATFRRLKRPVGRPAKK